MRVRKAEEEEEEEEEDDDDDFDDDDDAGQCMWHEKSTSPTLPQDALRGPAHLRAWNLEGFLAVHLGGGLPNLPGYC